MATASSYKRWRSLPTETGTAVAYAQPLIRLRMANMLDPVSSRFVMFFFARCRDDLSWYLSIEPQTLARAANDSRARAAETLCGRDVEPQSCTGSTPASTFKASLMACTRPSIDRSSMCKVIEMRRRAVPAGTVGGRIARTSKPVD